MPLVLFVAVDNNGITCLVGGALISDESFDSYKWVLNQLKDCSATEPKVMFTDGDQEFAKAIVFVFPNTIHLLCRWHISQNITKKLAAELRKDLNQFLDDFWRIGSIEEMEEYLSEWEMLKGKWTHKAITSDYIETLEAKQAKLAFAFTHCNFVAGISSTQRQESVNYQTKCDLITNSTLSQLVVCFERLDENSIRKMAVATLNTKLSTASGVDPIIENATKELTRFASEILMNECTLSLSYTCESKDESETCTFLHVSHREHPLKFRTVRFDKTGVDHNCSCRKSVWHGIVCRHLIAVLRRMNVLKCPLDLFNSRWWRDFASLVNQNTARAERMLTGIDIETASISEKETCSQRVSELSAIAKDCISRCIYDDGNFQLVKSNLVSVQKLLHASMHVQQTRCEGGTPNAVLNPLKLMTKGRPKRKRTRVQSIAEQQRQRKAKGHATIKCGRCKGVGHGISDCPAQ